MSSADNNNNNNNHHHQPQQIPSSVFTTTRIRSGQIDHSNTAYAHLMTAPRPNNNNNVNAQNAGSLSMGASSVTTPQLPGAKKKITSEMLMPNFKALPAYKELINFISDLSLSCLAQDCRPTEKWVYDKNNNNNDAEKFEISRVDLATATSASTSNHHFASAVTPIFIEFFTELHTWVCEIPLEQLMKSRFGNLAYRVFQTRLREHAEKWIQKFVAAGHVDGSKTSEQLASVAEELLPYMLDSFGNAVRIDYGTGHELHFLLIIFILNKNGLLGVSSSSSQENALQEMVLVVLDEYWRLMNRLQQHYRLEPAGSHGVWGLDDFHHLPFILGAAQFSPSGSWQKENLNGPSSLSSSATIASAPLPAEIPSKPSCEEIAPKNFLFRAVLNIHRTKSGPFGEHSGVLQSISGLASWPRVLTGMIKMFEGEVLGKFMIVQHLLFGKSFAWETVADTTAKRP